MSLSTYLRTDQPDDTAVLVLLGDLADDDLPSLDSALERAAATSARRIVLDMTGVGTSSMAATRFLLTARQRLAPGRELILAREHG